MPRTPPTPPPGGPWLTTAQATEVLGLTRIQVRRLAQTEGIEVVRDAKRWWLDEADVRELAARRRQWVSQGEAARIVGCSEDTIKSASADGRIEKRDVHRVYPSLSRASVEAFAEQWAEEKRRRADAAAERAARAAAWGPPDDEHVWLSASTTAALLGVSLSWVRILAAEGRLPATRKAGRYWIRRDHAEQVAAARAAAARFE